MCELTRQLSCTRSSEISCDSCSSELDLFKAVKVVFKVISVVGVSTGPAPTFQYEGLTVARLNKQALLANDSIAAYPSVGITPTEYLKLYISFDVPSPRFLPPRTDVSPYRYSLDNADGSLYTCSGLPAKIYIDEELLLTVWGNELAMQFTQQEAFEEFISNLPRVTVLRSSLSNHRLQMNRQNQVVTATLHRSRPRGIKSAMPSASLMDDVNSDVDLPPR